MHPSRAGLMAFADTEAGTAARHRVAGHIAKCGKCRGELRQIQREKDAISVGDGAGSEIYGSEIGGSQMATTGADLAAGLAELLSSMTAWREGRTAVLASEVKSRVRSQIELYLGSPAVLLLEQPCCNSREMRADALLANAGEILETLLGPAAAEAVMDDVMGGLDCARRAAETHRSAPVKTYPQAPAKTHPQAQAKTQK
jgi:hypothetical protein